MLSQTMQTEATRTAKAKENSGLKILPIYAPGGFGASGYDPVAYFKVKKAVKGKANYTYVWKKAKWRFSSKANLEAFKKNPVKYSPQYGGHCAFGVAGNYLVKGDPEAWTVLNGKLYLNYDKECPQKMA